MPKPSYQKPGLILKKGDIDVTESYVSDLQEDLRRLGYLKKNIDGNFGPGTERAVKALSYDLLYIDGSSTKDVGDAPLLVFNYNIGRFADVTISLDSSLGACLSDMLIDPEFPKLPKVDDPDTENDKIVNYIKQMSSTEAPIPFIIGILKQESRLKHFHEPSGNDRDTYIVVGQDTNASSKHIITSRGYGAGQYTLFHHPPGQEEIEDFMLDVEKNIQKAVKELQNKFKHFVNGEDSGTKADDRIAEYGTGDLRFCKFQEDDTRYMKDCVQCMKDAGQYDIEEGVTHWYAGSNHTYFPTQYYRKASYDSVPVRSNIGCDWPYAARRYNGSGINSYHYQTRVLINVYKLGN